MRTIEKKNFEKFRKTFDQLLYEEWLFEIVTPIVLHVNENETQLIMFLIQNFENPKLKVLLRDHSEENPAEKKAGKHSPAICRSISLLKVSLAWNPILRKIFVKTKKKIFSK